MSEGAPVDAPVDVADDAAAGRRMQLRRRRRSRRRRLIGFALAVLVALTVALTVELARDTTAPTVAVPPQQRTQRTLLLQVQAPNGEAAASALLAEDPASRSGAVLLVPPQTLVPVPGVGSLTVAKALTSVPPAGSRNALADALGVTVDAGWVLDRPSLVRLVDALGGIAVEVDAPVVRGNQLVLQPGSQHIDGEHAYAYLTYLAPGEQEQVRLARLQQVLDGVLGALPATAPDTVPLLAGLGSRSITSLPVEDLARLLVGLEDDDQASALQYETLPVVPIDTGAGGATAAFRIDATATRAVVDRLLAGSVPPGTRDARNRVLVLNGVGTPGIGEQVRSRLVPKGFSFVGSRNAGRFGYARTQVLVPDATPEAQALGLRVAQALGLAADAVRSSDQLGSVADVVVLVGSDFRS